MQSKAGGGTTTSNNVDRYMKLEKLGEGTYGVVHKAKDRQTGEVGLAPYALRLWLARK